MSSRSKGGSKVAAIKERLSAQDLQELKTTFQLFDEEKTGAIDPNEIQSILKELGLDRRNEVVYLMINDLKQKNKNISFDDFIEVVYNRLGDTKTKDGISRIFALYDQDGEGSINFDKVKHVARELGETMNDEEILEMMHNTHILNQTQSNQMFTFDQFYEIVTKKKY